MANIFQHVLAKKPKRSTFNLSHDVKLTMEMGKLVPFLCEEVVPGDTWKNKTTCLVRFAPLQAPVMHRIWVTTHFFYVPFRLLWDDFEEFITGGPTGNSTPAFPVIELLDGQEGNPYHDVSGKFAPGSLADYLNYPTSDSNMSGGGLRASALPLRAYQLIFDEYYRDENLEAEVAPATTGGLIAKDSAEYNKLLTLRNRAWRKDYFTSALPWTQRGREQEVPIHGQGSIVSGQQTNYIPVQFDNRISLPAQLYSAGENNEPLGGIRVGSNHYVESYETAAEDVYKPLAIEQPGQFINIEGKRVNLEGGTFNINELRRASRIQKWLERQARSGSRYIESLASHFGVISDDLRLQRPEFLGGGTNPVQISDVLQTSETTASSPQAQPAGVGFSLGGSNEFKRTFKERGLILGILSVVPEPAYSQGLPRAYRKFDKFDFYWPEFARLGEQPIYNFELACCRGVAQHGGLDGTFGYAPRFAEYKYIPSRVHGDFKTDLDFWTLNRKFDEQPTLTKEFVTVDAERNDLNRIFAVEDYEYNHLWVQLHNDIVARRPMPYLPDPTL